MPSNSLLHILLAVLIFLLFLAAFFSVAETSMMSLNRYRLRHLARHKHRPARRAQKLLDRTDRLLGVILIGSTLSTILASTIATVIAEKLFGAVGIAVTAGALTLIILIFCEIMPKTLAALYSERLAFLTTIPLAILLKIFYPLVWSANVFVNTFLLLFGINVRERKDEFLTIEELRSIVHEAGEKISPNHQEMLLRILDLEKVVVEDAMIPRNEIQGINTDDDWEIILEKITHSAHTRLPVYAETINHLHGILNLRTALNLMATHRLTKDTLMENLQEAHFVPEGTPLNQQLLHFRHNNVRNAFVVDEYGEILGLISLEDILEEIVGDLTLSRTAVHADVREDTDGSFLVNAGTHVRELNRMMRWHFTTEGPKTLSGLIIEYLEVIPQPGICLRLSGYPIEIVDVKKNRIKTVRVMPQWVTTVNH